MSEDTVYKTKKISQNDLEKYYKVKLTKEEFEVVKSFAFDDYEEVVGDDYKFYPFDQYVFSIKQWGTKSGKIRKKSRYQSLQDLLNSLNSHMSFGLKKSDEVLNFTDQSMQDLYVKIQDEIDNRYPKLEKKRETIREQNKQILKDYKKEYSTSAAPNPDLIIGLVVFVFLTWLIFGVIFGGGDLSPGGPKFFGHDGG